MGLGETLDVLVRSEPFERLLLERARPIVARAEAGEDFVVAGVATALDAPVLAVAPGPREADALAADLEAFLGTERVALLPAWEALPYEGISPAPEIAARRARGGRRPCERQRVPFVLVAPALAAMQGLIPTLGLTPALQLVAGLELPPDALAERLVELGYSRADVVEHRGEFAVRGGVVDVFPGTARRPVRLDYWGDEVESIREFVPSTQLSTERVALAEVPATRELIPDDALRDRARAAAAGGVRSASPTSSSASPTGCSSRAPRRSRRSCSMACRRRPSCCPTGRGWCSRTSTARWTGRRRRTWRPRRSPRPRRGRRPMCSTVSTMRSARTCACT